MNKKMKKISILVMLLILIAGIGIVAAQSFVGIEKVKQQTSAIKQPQRLLYTKMCCIQDKYYVNYYTPEDYLQVPISVEVWDKNLNPVNAVKVHVQIYDNSGAMSGTTRFDQTKSTGTNGIAKFGYSEAYPYGPGRLTNPKWTNGPKIIKVVITNTNGYSTYMEKVFTVDGD
jgi:hypothetical protein